MAHKKPGGAYHRLAQLAGISLMRLFFRLLYHSMAWTYDLVAATVSVGRWKTWVEGAIRMVEGVQVLELGFGPGHLQVRLAERTGQAFGLDESRQMARQARRRLAGQGLPAHLVRGLAQHLPYSTAQFDTIIATFPTLYIIDPDTLSEINRVLRPGGRLVVLMAAWITGKSLPDRFMSALFRLTGQVPAEHETAQSFTGPYEQAGFRASLRFVEQPGSRLMFIIAERV